MAPGRCHTLHQGKAPAKDAACPAACACCCPPPVCSTCATSHSLGAADCHPPTSPPSVPQVAGGPPRREALIVGLKNGQARVRVSGLGRWGACKVRRVPAEPPCSPHVSLPRTGGQGVRRQPLPHPAGPPPLWCALPGHLPLTHQARHSGRACACGGLRPRHAGATILDALPPHVANLVVVRRRTSKRQLARVGTAVGRRTRAEVAMRARTGLSRGLQKRPLWSPPLPPPPVRQSCLRRRAPTVWHGTPTAETCCAGAAAGR